ncbi:MAG: response regulator [Lentimicrobiaceae bacterium]|nr:response regulator [Lentimicrobiaceae bacterium]
MSSKPRILVVEDEPKVLSFIKKGLEENGFDVHTAENGPDGLDLARALDFSIIILDIMLPGLSGIELAMQLHRTGNKSRILMLTALGTLDDKLRGFDAGAHDYLVKPFEFPELLARVRSLLRRESDEATSQFLRAADLTMDLDRKVVKRGDVHIDLTAREFMLLEYLLRNKGRVVSKVDIAEKVWDINFDTGTNVIEVYINFLRKKVDRDFEPKLIYTLIGMGYILKED